MEMAACTTPATSFSVLIVDDEPSVRTVTMRILARGFDAVPVASAEAALTLLAGGAFFDVILCDLNLSGMSGRDLFARLQAEYPAQAARLVMVSGMPPSSDDDALVEELEHRWLEKPIRPEQLRSVASAVASSHIVAR